MDTVYLDTNVLLDWIGRNQARGTHAGVGGLINAICKNEMAAVVSEMTRLEILECKNEPTMMRAWAAFRARKNVQVAGMTRAVMDRAYEIRNYYQERREADPRLKRAPSIPDSVHVATALIFNCSTLYTFDGGGRDPKSVSPLDMQPLVAGRYSLRIARADDAPVLGMAV